MSTLKYRTSHKNEIKKAAHEYYIKNKEKYRLSFNARRKKIRDFINHLKNKPCMDCQKSYPPHCMDFDHRRDKKFQIANAVILHYGESKILEEAEKCDVVCSNCHRIRTFNRRQK